MRLLLITQVVDPRDSILGFFCEWLEGIAGDSRVEFIDVWCLRKGEWSRKPDNLNVHVLPKGKVFRIWKLFTKLVWTEADTVFVHMVPIWTALGGWLWRLRGKRVVLWYTHGHPSIWLRVSLPFVHRVLTATPQAFPIKTRKMYSPGHGISSKFAEVSSKRSQADHLRFIGVGRISSSKRVLETIQFFERILRQEPKATFVWVGGPRDESGRSYERRLREYIESQGLGDHVSLIGPKPHEDLPALFSKADLFIHFSVTNSLDKVAPEALMAGCSVFSTNPAVKEVLPEYHWGGDLSDEAAVKAVDSARKGVSREDRKKVAEQFSLDTLVRKVVEQFISR